MIKEVHGMEPNYSESDDNDSHRAHHLGQGTQLSLNLMTMMNNVERHQPSWNLITPYHIKPPVSVRQDLPQI